MIQVQAKLAFGDCTRSVDTVNSASVASAALTQFQSSACPGSGQNLTLARTLEV